MQKKQALTWYYCRQNMLCSTKTKASIYLFGARALMFVKQAHFYISLLVGLTCLAGRRCYHSRSPHRDPSPVAWRAFGSLLPDPEARRGECWRTPSRWSAAEAEDRESSAFHNRFLSSIGGEKNSCSVSIEIIQLFTHWSHLRTSPSALAGTHHELWGTVQLHGAGALKWQKQNVWLPGRCLNISSQCLVCAFMHHWPAVSCCAPGRCPCSPDASCISQCWSRSDN